MTNSPLSSEASIKLSGGWRWKFAFLPTRIGPRHTVWLQWYQRRLVEDDPGNWAGGWTGHYEFREGSRSPIWRHARSSLHD